MVALYCRAHHEAGAEPCDTCRALIVYAHKRLEACPFQQDKPTCGHCRVHCYKPEARGAIQEIMRYAGPRMLWRHPLLALRHLLDSWRKSPSLQVKDPGKKHP